MRKIVLSNSIDEILGQLACEEVEGSSMIISLSDYMFQQRVCTPLDDNGRNILNMLFVEYVIFGNSGEGVAYDLTHDIAFQGIRIVEQLDCEDKELIDTLETVMHTIRTALDRQIVFNRGNSSTFPAVVRWISEGPSYVVEVRLFKQRDWDD